MNKQLRAARRARNASWVLLALMVAANLALAFNIYRETNQVVLVPSQIADGMVARGAVDRRYVEALAVDAVSAMYTVHPETLDYGRKTVARLARDRDRAKLIESYDRVGEDMQVRKISTVFFIDRMETSVDGMKVRVFGQLATFLETTRTSIEDRVVLVTFAQQGASVRVSSIQIGRTDA